MKKITLIFSLIGATVLLFGCKKDGIDNDLSFLNSAKVDSTSKIFDISNDNSGKVTITPVAQGASSFIVQFGHGTGADAEAAVEPGYSVTHIYPEGTYQVTIISKSLTGEEVSNTYPLEVIYRAPENIEITASTNVHVVTVKATADYAASFEVYFGDVQNETPTPLPNGAEVSHTYAAAGTYTVKVVALSGGAATSEKTTEVRVYDPFGLPITFDNPNVNYFFGTFGDNQQFAVVANPNASGLNTSEKVGQFIRGVQSWSGTYSPLNDPIDMSKGKKIRVYGYNPDPAMIGKALNVELEAGSTIANGIAVLKTAFTTSGQWEELVFDFGTISEIPDDEKFAQLVLRFNDSQDGAGAVIYVDNFRQTN